MKKVPGKLFLASLALVLVVGLTALVAACGSSTTARSEGKSISAASIANPALKQIVSGVVARGLIVTSASVITESPLKLSIVVTAPADYKGAGFIEPQVEREATAEWVRDREPDWLDIQVVDAQGKVLAGRGMPLSPASMSFDPSLVPPPKVDRTQAGEMIARSIPSLLPPPLKLVAFDLKDDVLSARLLYLEVFVPDFEKNTGGYLQAFTDVESKVNELNLSEGTAVGVQWMQAVDEQGRVLYASYYDFQLQMAIDEPGLITDFQPRFFPAPPIPMSSTTTTVSSAGTTSTVTFTGSSATTSITAGQAQTNASTTLAGLGSLRLDVTPRPGLRLQASLAQYPGSGVVVLILTIKNDGDSVFSYGVEDFTLYVDGSPLKAKAQVHTPTVAQVKPGETGGVTGGYFWQLSRPTSDSTGLFYLSSDPGSTGFNRMVSVQ